MTDTGTDVEPMPKLWAFWLAALIPGRVLPEKE